MSKKGKSIKNHSELISFFNMFQDKSSYALPSTNDNARGGKKYLFCSDTGTQIKVVIGINIVLVILTVILLVVNSLWLNPGKPKKCSNSNFIPISTSIIWGRFIPLKTLNKSYSRCKIWENFTIWNSYLLCQGQARGIPQSCPWFCCNC